MQSLGQMEGSYGKFHPKASHPGRDLEVNEAHAKTFLECAKEPSFKCLHPRAVQPYFPNAAETSAQRGKELDLSIRGNFSNQSMIRPKSHFEMLITTVYT